ILSYDSIERIAYFFILWGILFFSLIAICGTPFLSIQVIHFSRFNYFKFLEANQIPCQYLYSKTGGYFMV
ncbi:hypothetical protein COJ98_31970, partial [Bacillus cereus]